MDKLEGYFRKSLELGIVDHSIRATEIDGVIKFHIHPTNHSGKTLDFVVFDNQLKTVEEYKRG